MNETQAEAFLKFHYNVSRETFLKIREFYQLLLKWNKKIHLLSNNETDNIWQRHILDCYQLNSIITSTQDLKLVDYGSGTGFPGIISALMTKWKEVHLIESNIKKHLFLEEASRISNNKVIVHNQRVEDLDNLHADIVTARAFADLNKLLYYAQIHSKSGTRIFTFKGKNIDQEIKNAKKHWAFNLKSYKSNVLNDSFIIEIENIEAANGTST